MSTRGSLRFQKLSIGLDPPSIAPLSVNAGITEIPKLSIGLAQLTIEPLTITVTALALAIGITEFPSIRVHLPAHFTAALSIVGRQLFCARLCGEAQLTTEPYDPNLCERCRNQPGSEAADAPTDIVTRGQRMTPSTRRAGRIPASAAPTVCRGAPGRLRCSFTVEPAASEAAVGSRVTAALDRADVQECVSFDPALRIRSCA